MSRIPQPQRFTKHELRVIYQIHDLLDFPIQVHLLYLFDKQINEDFRIYGITFLKYRILRQIKVVPKEALSLIQWPMNAYGKWFHENPSLFYLAEDELEDLKAEIKRQSPDIATDFDDVKEYLIPKEQSCV
uniref:Uncharacterized protein n=1 Tax=Panagrolaimus sp. JU765 TaxID=591449 RepID=A0AC34Q4Q5_9BILA